MSVAEARSEIKASLEKADLIEKKYPDGDITNGEDLTEVKRLLGLVDGLEEKLVGLEDSEQRRARIMSGMERYSKPARNQVPNPHTQEILEGKRMTPGDQFIQSREYRELKLGGAFQSSLARNQFHVKMADGTSLIEWKTTLVGSDEASGGGFVRNDRQAGFVPLLQREIVVMDLIPRLTTTSDTIEYVKEDTFTNAAAFTAEATGSATTGTVGVKPESTLAYSVATMAVRTLAHWIPVTNRMLDDAPQVRGIINSRLLLGLDLTLESQVVAGNGSGENFEGLLQNTSVNYAGKGSDNELDAIFKARTLVRVTGKGRPNACLIYPTDWQAIRLLRESASTATPGSYLMGPPSQVGAVTVWGIPVVESQAITENTVLVGDFAQGCTLFDREQAAIRIGTINDQFVRNIQTILAELRAAFVIWRPTMFTKVTGM
jgi:HK97 family phage major capsid protein